MFPRFRKTEKTAEKTGHISLTPEARNCTLHCMIEPNQQIGLFFNFFRGETELENVAVIRE